MQRSVALRVAALLALATPVSALASYDGDFYVITPSSTGMLGSYVYSVVHDDATGQTWVAADDPVWDEGGIASTFDGLTWDSYSNVNEEVPTHLVQELHVGPDGMVWGASELGLLRFDGDSVEIA